VWADLCRPDRPPTGEWSRLYDTFTVLEGRRFRFRTGDPTATAALLRQVLEAAAGVPVRTTLEPAAERTPLGSGAVRARRLRSGRGLNKMAVSL
jgi:hypothetical protein